jgi:glyoxylase-like metal-dependent hydrolase (beta-lactamase superfamily II)
MPEGRLTIGQVEILGLSDATVDYPWTLDQLFPNVPTPSWEPYRQRFPETFASENVWRSDYTCYLLRSGGRTVLLDTGMGPADSALAAALGLSGQLLAKLGIAGVRPEEIDLVVLSHLHPDHVGWNLRREAGAYRPTFSKARYIVHRADWDAFQRPDVQSLLPFDYVDQTITPLESLGVLDLIDGERSITSELSVLHTPGHTPGHMSVLITSGDERAMLLGDVAIHPAQVTEPDWNAMFDMDGDVARQTRRVVLDRIEAEGMTVAARHFPEPGFGRLVRVEGRRYWQGF